MTVPGNVLLIYPAVKIDSDIPLIIGTNVLLC